MDNGFVFTVGILVGFLVLSLLFIAFEPSQCKQIGVEYGIVVAETGGVCYVETEDGSLVDLVEFLP